MLPSCPFFCTVTRLCDYESCERPALVAAYSFNDTRFCSCEHRDETVQLKRRELNRLDKLLNEILLLNTGTLHGYHIIRNEQTASGLLVLHQEEYDRPLRYYTPAVDKQTEEIGFCYNSCIHAMQTLAGVLAYLAEGIGLVRTPKRYADNLQGPFGSRKQT
jgi:hypothetical protein